MMHQSESNDLTSEYIKEVSESLLRRMEIKQENILKFDAPFLDGSYLILEQIRFILATLEIASKFNDLRLDIASPKAPTPGRTIPSSFERDEGESTLTAFFPIASNPLITD